MAVDNRTPNRDYPLPDPTNNLDEDVLRLIAALRGIDADVETILVGLAGKAAIVHGHEIDAISGLQSALNGKAALNHTHALDDLSDVNVAGSANGQFLKKIGTSWGPATLQIGDIHNLQTTLDGKASLQGQTALVVPEGTTEQRPSEPMGRLLRWNTTTSLLELWNGTEWVPFGGNLDASAISWSNEVWWTGAANVEEVLVEVGGWLWSLETEAIPPGYVSGLTLANNAANATRDIDIAPGRARGNGVTVVNGSTLTKRLDQVWAAGNGQGGTDVPIVPSAMTLHAHALRNDATKAFDVVFSQSATAPTVPSGWTRVQRLGAVLTDGSGNIRSFRQVGNTFWHNVSGGIQDFSAAGVWTKNLFVFSVPNGIRVEGIFQPLILANAATVGHVILYDGENPNVSVILSAGSLDAGGGAVVSYNRSPMKQFTNASRQIYVEMTSGVNPSTPSAIATLGWNDYQIPRIGA